MKLQNLQELCTMLHSRCEAGKKVQLYVLQLRKTKKDLHYLQSMELLIQTKLPTGPNLILLY